MAREGRREAMRGRSQAGRRAGCSGQVPGWPGDALVGKAATRPPRPKKHVRVRSLVARSPAELAGRLRLAGWARQPPALELEAVDEDDSPSRLDRRPTKRMS